MTIYIMSKGRPQCITARTLERMGYPGDWFIVCGDNDETIPEYVRNWGEGRVMVFDWAKHAKGCDLMDCRPLAPSGAVPARNAIGAIARSRGELRHWQFDDDYEGFTVFNGEKYVKPTGRQFRRLLDAYEEFGFETGVYAVGFSVSTGFLRPDIVQAYRKNVTNCFNFRSDPWVPWIGRLLDDTCTPLAAHRRGEIEFNVPLAGAQRKDREEQMGGLCDLYASMREYEQCMRPVMCCPSGVKVHVKADRMVFTKRWNQETVRIVSEEVARE